MSRKSFVEMCSISSSSTSSDNQIYSPVSTSHNANLDLDFDDDDIDSSNPYSYKSAIFNHGNDDPHNRPQPSRTCPTCCMIFSIIGCIFLSFLAILLGSSSKTYLRFHESSDMDSASAKSNVIGAAVCYGLLSAYCYYIIKFQRPCCPSKQQIINHSRNLKNHLR